MPLRCHTLLNSFILYKLRTFVLTHCNLWICEPQCCSWLSWSWPGFSRIFLFGLIWDFLTSFIKLRCFKDLLWISWWLYLISSLWARPCSGWRYPSFRSWSLPLASWGLHGTSVLLYKLWGWFGGKAILFGIIKLPGLWILLCFWVILRLCWQGSLLTHCLLFVTHSVILLN